MSELPAISFLSCKVQEYPWGTVGHESRVAKYASATKENNFSSKADGTYAELWCGSAHPNGASSVVLPDGTLKDLKDIILEHPEQVYGKAINRLSETARQKGQVPFLFKTLCAGKALPLQIHPDKKLAEVLKYEWPEDLPDDNHKPEIGLALSDFQAFASLRPFEQIQSSVKRIPELRDALGELAERFMTANASEKALREAIAHILKRRQSDPSTMTNLVKRLAARCVEEGDKALGADLNSADHGLASTFALLNQDYPGDSGAFICAFFMNLFKLKAGECIYVPADGLHAWFRGDIIECMANSDNVLNSAFTEVDDQTLKVFSENVLVPTNTPSEHWFVKTKAFDRCSHSKTVRYLTPFNEFDILWVNLQGGEEELHQGIQGPSVSIITEGSGYVKADGKQIEVKMGHVLLTLAGKEMHFRAGEGGMQVYRCFSE